MFDSTLLVPSVVFFLYMTLLWLIGLSARNAGFVDFGWPSGFTALAVFYAWTGDGFWVRKTLLVSLYCLCGARFMIGWMVRNIRDGEDRRWRFWRDRWKKGEGLFAVRSVPANLFAFYHAQTFATLLVLIVPLSLACNNPSAYIHLIEWIAVGLWAMSFLLENVADLQLDRFRIQSAGAGGVCRAGFWKYSRHPNYFFEFSIWVAYALFAIPSANGILDYVGLALVPIVAYWFLAYFTGIPMTEVASLQRRGEPYARYQAETNRFFPWFPKKPMD